MKKKFNRLSITHKLLFGFAIDGVLLVLLCLLTLGIIYRMVPFNALICSIITAALFVLIVLNSWLTIRRVKKRTVPYIVGLTMGIKKLVDGNLSYFNNDPHYDVSSKDEMVKMALTFIELVNSIREKVADTRQLANGDLTTHIHLRCDEDDLGQALIELVNNTHRVVSTISATADQVASGSNLVANSSFSLSQGATMQASSIQQLTASLVEVASQTTVNAKNAEKANEFVKEAKENAGAGNEHMKNMLSAMDDISDSSSNIGKIIKVIDDIAFQTNILALNAAVEAARAGQHGKGFAVVAEEVRSLAAKSANAARETTDLIEGSKNKVDAGTKIARATAEALSQIVRQVDVAADLVSSIAQASNEQAGAIDEINNGIQQVSQVVTANAATSEESAAASEELSSQAASLKETTSVFKLKTASKPVGGRAAQATRLQAERLQAERLPAGKTEPANKVSLGNGDYGKY